MFLAYTQFNNILDLTIYFRVTDHIVKSRIHFFGVCATLLETVFVVYFKYCHILEINSLSRTPKNEGIFIHKKMKKGGKTIQQRNFLVKG